MKRADNSLTFIIPGLLDPVPYLDQLPIQELPELPVFCKILSRGDFSIPESLDHSDNNFYRCVMQELPLLKNAGDTACQPSIASLSYLSDVASLSAAERLHYDISLDDLLENTLNKKWIIRADPSFMVADRDQLVLAQSGASDLSMAEATSLADEINHFYSGIEEESFWTLKAVSADRWYIISDKPIGIQTAPPENVLGQSVKPFLFGNTQREKGAMGNEDSSHWLNLFNEFQMILHRSQVNKNRLDEKKIAINSLWFWGAEKLSQLNAPSDATKFCEMIYSNNAFVQSLSVLNHQKCTAVPKELFFNRAEPEQHLIYIMDDFIQAIRNKDLFTWVGLLAQFEQHYLIPLMKEINAGNIARIEFISPCGIRLLLTKKALRRWWRKTQKYYTFLGNNERLK